MAYLLDTSVFIDAKDCYDIEFCPAFWEWLLLENDRKHLFCTGGVRDEILALEQDDWLAEWLLERDDNFVLSIDPATLDPALHKISEWAKENYREVAYRKFLDLKKKAADYFLVASALASHHTVVSLEKGEPELKKEKQIKIPDACESFKIQHITPYQMLRENRVSFRLGKRDSSQHTDASK